MKTISVVVHGLGNIGRYVLQALEAASDMRCVGVVRRASSLGTHKTDLRGVQDYASLADAMVDHGKPDVAVMCGPSRQVPEDVPVYLAAGINTVDSYDIHATMPQLISQLEGVTRQHGRVSISGAGWDPGTDSMLRALFEAMTPVGTTFTNFGRGRSMGHSVAVRAIDGVQDATAITIPIGGGRHSRLVYVLPQQGIDVEKIRAAIAADPYFVHDPLEVRFVRSAEELAAVADNSHGVLMERLGAASMASNQRLQFDMRVDNPALTAQVLVSSARAATRLSPGAYTLIDVPVVAMLPGDRMSHIARLV